MKVPRSHVKAVRAIAQATPPQVIANLLRVLMPRAPVASRAPVGTAPLARAINGALPRPASRKPRSRARRGDKRYTVIDTVAALRTRESSWRGKMLRAIVCSAVDAADDGAYSTLAYALAYMREHYPQDADKGVDLNWAARENIIKFV